MTYLQDLRAQAERCRLVGLRYGSRYRPMQLLADQLDAQAQAIEHHLSSLGPGNTALAL